MTGSRPTHPRAQLPPMQQFCRCLFPGISCHPAQLLVQPRPPRRCKHVFQGVQNCPGKECPPCPSCAARRGYDTGSVRFAVDPDLVSHDLDAEVPTTRSIRRRSDRDSSPAFASSTSSFPTAVDATNRNLCRCVRVARRHRPAILAFLKRIPLGPLREASESLVRRRAAPPRRLFFRRLAELSPVGSIPSSPTTEPTSPIPPAKPGPQPRIGAMKQRQRRLFHAHAFDAPAP